MHYHLPIEITLEDGLWMARSSAIQGLLVTGTSLAQLFSELPIVSKVLFETCQEHSWSFVKEQPEIKLADIIWQFELPQPILEAA